VDKAAVSANSIRAGRGRTLRRHARRVFYRPEGYAGDSTSIDAKLLLLLLSSSSSSGVPRPDIVRVRHQDRGSGRVVDDGCKIRYYRDKPFITTRAKTIIGIDEK